MTKFNDFCNCKIILKHILILYQDGFVLVGSVTGHRYWSSMLHPEGTVTCGAWSPDDQQVCFKSPTVIKIICFLFI